MRLLVVLAALAVVAADEVGEAAVVDQGLLPVVAVGYGVTRRSEWTRSTAVAVFDGTATKFLPTITRLNMP